jgi:hypothetical protein
MVSMVARDEILTEEGIESQTTNSGFGFILHSIFAALAMLCEYSTWVLTPCIIINTKLTTMVCIPLFPPDFGFYIISIKVIIYGNRDCQASKGFDKHVSDGDAGFVDM